MSSASVTGVSATVPSGCRTRAYANSTFCEFAAYATEITPSAFTAASDCTCATTLRSSVPVRSAAYVYTDSVLSRTIDSSA
jgi:hypothetical protein